MINISSYRTGLNFTAEEKKPDKPVIVAKKGTPAQNIVDKYVRSDEKNKRFDTYINEDNHLILHGKDVGHINSLI